MLYINLRLTYLLTYFYTAQLLFSTVVYIWLVSTIIKPQTDRERLRHPTCRQNAASRACTESGQCIDCLATLASGCCCPRQRTLSTVAAAAATWSGLSAANRKHRDQQHSPPASAACTQHHNCTGHKSLMT